MIFRRKGLSEREVAKLIHAETQFWGRLVYMGQVNFLDLAQAMLRVIDDPDSVTEEVRATLTEMIVEVRDGVARYEEHHVL